MTKSTLSYTDFSSGEISPKLYGRFDLSAYYSGHKRVENFIVDSTGQASFRNGTSYVAEASGRAFLHPFIYNASLAYMLEFTENKIRFYSRDGIVESGGLPVEVVTTYAEEDLFQLKFAQNGVDIYIAHPNYNPKKLTYSSPTSWSFSDHSPVRETFADFQAISNISKSNPAVVTYTGSDNFTNGDRVKITGVSGMEEVNDRIFEIGNVSTGSNTFELSGVDSTGYSTYSSGGITQRIIENAAPFLSAGEYPASVAFYENRLVYGGSENTPNVLYFSRTPSTVSGRLAYTDDFSLGTEVDDGIEYFVSGDGNSVRWLRGTSKFLAIGTFGDVLQATGGIDGVITPDSISIRPSNSYGVLDVNPIGKNTNVFYVQNNGVILRSFEYKFESDTYIPVDRNVIADHITQGGVSQIAFQEGRPNIIWMPRNDGQMLGMTIEESEGVSGWHRHTTQGEIVSVSSLPRENRDNQLWVCVKRTINGVDKYYIEFMNDKPEFPVLRDYFTDVKSNDYSNFANQMFEAQKNYIHVDSCLTYDGTLAGIDAGASVTPAAITGTGITFTASASVFLPSDVGREIWNKSITGAETGRAVITAYTSDTEVTCDIIEDFNSTDTIVPGNWYLTASEVIGLSHLEGMTVTIAADGGQHPQKIVSGGAVELIRQCSVVHVGLGYRGWIETNSLEGGGTNGTSQTKKKSLVDCGVRFLNTLFGEVGPSYYNLEPIYERTSAMRMDRPPVLFSGDKKVNINKSVSNDFDAGWQREKNVIITQDLPFPMNVQLIIPYLNTSNV